MHGSGDKTEPRPKEEFLGQNGSFTKVTNRLFSQGRFLTANAKVLYITLLSYRYEGTYKTFPKYEKISDRSNLTRPAISKALKELKRFGWVQATRRFSESTFYILGWPGGDLEGRPSPTKEEANEWRTLNRRGRWRQNNKWKRQSEQQIKEAEKDDIPF